MTQQLKLFLVLLGCTPPNRHVEQHDIFLCIAGSLEELYPAIKAYWPEGRVHIDAWREISKVEGYRVTVSTKDAEAPANCTSGKLFLMNLGGYLEGKFEEQHYIVLTVKPDKASATKEAKASFFYQHNHFGKAVSHIDDRYGIDVDDIYEIDELLLPAQKEQYRIDIIPAEGSLEDEMHLGYVKLPEGV